MEEHRLQALHDALCRHRKSEGLGTSTTYSWAASAVVQKERTDGLPSNALYAYFLKEGSFDPIAKQKDGDGRAIKRDFSDSTGKGDTRAKKMSKEERKAEKSAKRKAQKLAEKKAAKLEEKKRLKKEAKKQAKAQSHEKKRKTNDDAKQSMKKRRKLDSKEDEKLEPIPKKKEPSKDSKKKKKKSKQAKE